MAQSNVAERYLLSAANQERASRGIAPLIWNSALANAAADHARLMAARGRISHQFEQEMELSERGALAGTTFSLIAENVAEAPLATEIHEAWMQSEGHRENLLDREVDSVGISVLVRHGQMYAVEDFARVTPTLAAEEQEARVARLLEPSGLTIRSGSLETRRTCALDTGYSGSKRPEFVMRYNASTLERLPDELVKLLNDRRYRVAEVGACEDRDSYPFSGYRIAVLLYR